MLSSICAVMLPACLREQVPANYYTFTDDTIASFLEKNSDDFSTFIDILKKAKVWGEMQTYGTYTCFAPTNEAFSRYFEEKGIGSVDDLDYAECDTIARTHLLDRSYYTTDMVEGAFPTPNRLDRYLSFSCDSDSVTGRIYYLVNKDSRMIARDDTVQNGVMQIVDRVVVPSTLMLPELIEQDSTVSIFYNALVLTRMCDSLEYYQDLTYPTPSYDSITTGVKYHTGDEWEYAIFPEKRYFKYTVFAEPNSVYRKHNINNLEDLKKYAKEVYDKSYPNDALYRHSRSSHRL